VHAEHHQIFEHAMAGQEARAALALEAHIRATPDLLMNASKESLAGTTAATDESAATADR
jgi:DNA-binding GntR family transcriptional regulator